MDGIGLRAPRAPLLLLTLVAACGGGGDAGLPAERRLLLEGCFRADACAVKARGQVASCLAALDALRLGGTFEAEAEPYRCAAGVDGADCDAVGRCFGAGEAPPPCAAGEADRCDGDVARRCDLLDARRYAVDCAASELVCALDQGGTARCGLGSCDPTAFTPSCDGARALVCASGVIDLQDCAARGLACGAVGAGAGCVGEGEACDPREAVAVCDEDVLVGCASGGTARVDCAALPQGGRCAPQGDGAACVAPGEACAAGSAERCDGARAAICVDGFEVEIDCAALGFDRCVSEVAGVHCR